MRDFWEIFFGGLGILRQKVHGFLDSCEHEYVVNLSFWFQQSLNFSVLHMSNVICLTLVSVVTNYVKEMTRDCRYSLSRYYKALQTSAACHVTMSRSRSPLITKLTKHEAFNSRVCERPRHLGAYLGDKW